MFTLNEAKEAIKDKPEFVCKEREFGFAIDYNVAFEDTFAGKNERETFILKNLRGTLFDGSGKIIRLAYPKFHNLNENPEYHEKNFDFQDKHIIQEKLDGSLVTPVILPDGSWNFATRAGITDVSVMARNLFDSWKMSNFEKYAAYSIFIDRCLLENQTAMFEFCSREQRIVIDYPEPNLILTGIRCNETGFMGNNIVEYVSDPLVSVVAIVGTEGSSIQELAKNVKEWIGREGVVVKFDDGRIVKIKGEQYCLHHRSISSLRQEKDVIKLILTGGIDDVLPLIDSDAMERIVRFRESIHQRLKMANEELIAIFEKNSGCESKKKFAELISKSPYRTWLFNLWDKKPYSIEDYVVSKCGSSSGVEEVRWLIGKPYSEF